MAKYTFDSKKVGLIEEHLNGEIVAVHVFPDEYGMKGWYLQGVSFGHFTTRCRFLAFPHNRTKDPDHYLWVPTPGEHTWDYYEQYPSEEHIHHHASLWDAYIAVGYDYRYQKFKDKTLFDGRTRSWYTAYRREMRESKRANSK